MRAQLRASNDVMIRSSLMSGREVGMQTMNASLDSLRADGVISEGVYEAVVKDYASFA